MDAFSTGIILALIICAPFLLLRFLGYVIRGKIEEKRTQRAIEKALRKRDLEMQDEEYWKE